ncbi:hypothetical protein [Calothrix sp. NIES-3974]|uniref:hypothetical protein n=1 Tax=Calothrix sp. NIES-3974 TaxID=2005462 RepID=UPI000B60765B|nr:hypothetical protein [Calothrix sp. NIES-3974]BAZ06652.1 hypothetical protein NIES3974_33140 [Calothrix sp. NIES-3974]
MLLERLTLTSEEDTSLLRDRIPLNRELNLQNPNEVITELLRHLVYRNFKTIETNPNRWSLQENLVKLGTGNPHRFQVFVNISSVDNVFVQVEIVRQPDRPIILQKGNYKALEALEMVRNLPYFPDYQNQ